MSDTNLKPCPFCGGKAKYFGEALMGSISCKKCGCGVMVVGMEELYGLETLWNTRQHNPIELAARVAELEGFITNYHAEPICCNDPNGNECCGEPSMYFGDPEVYKILDRSPSNALDDLKAQVGALKESLSSTSNALYNASLFISAFDEDLGDDYSTQACEAWGVLRDQYKD